MDLNSFARFFVRFNALCFLFWAVYDLLDFPVVYQNYMIVHESSLRDAFLAREFLIYIARIALQLLAVVLLLGCTDKVIAFVLSGQWKTSTSNDTPK